MSRVFNPVLTAPDSYISTPASVYYDNLDTFTVALWVYPTSLPAGGYSATLIVKDPLNTYQMALYIEPDGTLAATTGGPAAIGPISSWGNPPYAPGLGYMASDTGTVQGGTIDADYEVYNVGSLGGVIDGGTGPSSSTFGDGFVVGQIVTTTATSGIGHGLEYRVTGINGAITFSQTTQTLTLNTWTHVLMTYSTSDFLIHIYINGIEATYSTQTAGGTPPDNSADGFYIGSDTYDDNFGGKLAEAVVYNTVLSGAQITALAASSTGATGSPVGYWHLCGTASPEPDASGHGNAGILSGNPPTGGSNSPGYNCSAMPPATPLQQVSIFGPGASTFINTTAPINVSTAFMTTKK